MRPSQINQHVNLPKGVNEGNTFNQHVKTAVNNNGRTISIFDSACLFVKSLDPRYVPSSNQPPVRMPEVTVPSKQELLRLFMEIVSNSSLPLKNIINCGKLLFMLKCASPVLVAGNPTRTGDNRCEDGEIACGDSDCIWEEYIGDSYSDCSDDWDEKNLLTKCPQYERIPCGETEPIQDCFTIDQLGDGIKNCENGYDENNVALCEKYGKVYCDDSDSSHYGECIDKRSIKYHRVADCKIDSELLRGICAESGSEPCRELNGVQPEACCIDIKEIGDGHEDCSNGWDESEVAILHSKKTTTTPAPTAATSSVGTLHHEAVTNSHQTMKNTASTSNGWTMAPSLEANQTSPASSVNATGQIEVAGISMSDNYYFLLFLLAVPVVAVGYCSYCIYKKYYSQEKIGETSTSSLLVYEDHETI